MRHFPHVKLSYCRCFCFRRCVTEGGRGPFSLRGCLLPWPLGCCTTLASHVLRFLGRLTWASADVPFRPVVCLCDPSKVDTQQLGKESWTLQPAKMVMSHTGNFFFSSTLAGLRAHVSEQLRLSLMACNVGRSRLQILLPLAAYLR